MHKKIIKYIKDIPQKPEKTRIKIMWVLVVFFMFIILGVWGFGFFYNQPANIRPDKNGLPPFPDFQSKLDKIAKLSKDADEAIKEANVEVRKKEAETIAENYLKRNMLFKDPDIASLKLKTAFKAENNWIIKYQQYYKGLFINGNDVTVAIDDKTQNVVSCSSTFDPGIKIGTEPKLTLEKAFQLAIKNLSDKNSILKSSEMMIFRDIDKSRPVYSLVWKLDLFSAQTQENYYYFMDAGSGKTILFYNAGNDKQAESM